MASPTPTLTPGSSPNLDSPSKGLGRVFEVVAKVATSWVGLLTAYAGAITAAVFAFQKLQEPLKDLPVWLRAALVAALPVLALVFHVIPSLIEQRRKKRLTEITGQLQTGYFRLAPRDDEASFARADGKHLEILRWLQENKGPVLYLTGLSGSGKSSLLTAWVLPNLERQNTLVIRLRGYQDPLAILEQELQKPGVVWERPSDKRSDLRSLFERACRHIHPRRLLIVLDQFEEFVILQDAERQQRLGQLLSSLREQPIGEVTFLLVFRSDYIGLIEKLTLPPLLQDTNWKEVPPFTESAARDFMRGSGLQASDELLRDVLREAAEIEQAKGLVRPVTVNLCGLVLGRFATGLPRGFRPGNLIRGFLRESITLPQVRDIATNLIPQLITSYVTKRPRTVTELAKDTTLDPAEVRGCLRVLGQSDRAIVRPLDAGQQTWEISHDFLVPLLDSITARWKMSLWQRLRAWSPWVAAMSLAIVAIAASRWQPDPILELTRLGWHVHDTDKALELQFEGVPPKDSLKVLQRTSKPLLVTLNKLDTSISEWRVLKNLSSLTIGGENDSDLFPLESLKNLSLLDLSTLRSIKYDRFVVDLSFLKDLKNLSSLNLSNLILIDLKPLKNLENLSSLNLSHVNNSSFRTVRDKNRLKILEDVFPIDLSPLKSLKKLHMLNLSYTEISDISSLKELTNLSSLDLSFTNVTDLSSLKDLENLSLLYIIRTPVKDVSPLKHLKNLHIYGPLDGIYGNF
jgi:hypothetical protein